MPAPPPDDIPDLEPEGHRDLDRYAEDSLDSGLAVAQGNLYVSAVEVGGEGGRRRGRGLGIGAWLAIGWLVFIVAIAVLAQLGALEAHDLFAVGGIDTQGDVGALPVHREQDGAGVGEELDERLRTKTGRKAYIRPHSL